MGGIAGGGKGGGSAPSFNQAKARASALETAQNNALIQQYGFENPLYNVSWEGNVFDPSQQQEPKYKGPYSQVFNAMSGGGKGGGSSSPTTTSRKMKVTLSPFAQKQLSLQESLLGQLGTNYGAGGAKRAEDAVYSQYTSRIEPEFEKQRIQTHTGLLNQGIPVGSEAYSRAMANLDKSQTDARQQALQNSVLTGAQTYSNSLSDILKQYGSVAPVMPQYQPGIGASTMSDPYMDAYNAAMQKYGIDSQNSNSLLGSVATLGAGIAMSDRRMKENIKKVGKLDNGLNVYVFNYKGENTPMIGLIAQEVMEVRPDAVIEGDDGYYRVFYDRAVI
jgi:hypothetical protein